MNMKWKQEPQKFGSPKLVYCVGTIRVASVEYNGSRSKEDTQNMYRYTCMLPGFKVATQTVATEDFAKQAVEKMVDNWIKAFNA